MHSDFMGLDSCECIFGQQPYCSLLNLVCLTEPNHFKRFSSLSNIFFRVLLTFLLLFKVKHLPSLSCFSLLPSCLPLFLPPSYFLYSFLSLVLYSLNPSYVEAFLCQDVFVKSEFSFATVSNLYTWSVFSVFQ